MSDKRNFHDFFDVADYYILWILANKQSSIRKQINSTEDSPSILLTSGITGINTITNASNPQSLSENTIFNPTLPHGYRSFNFTILNETVKNSNKN